MKGPSDSASSLRGDKVPGPEDFTHGAVYRAVLVDTIQHPMTILPAAVSGVGALYMALLGLDLAAFAVTFGAAVIAAGTWVYNYFIRGEDLARAHVDELRKRRREARHDLAKTLIHDWRRTGHREGQQQAEELAAAYQKLDELLIDRLAREGGGPQFTLHRLRTLAEDTYREGVGILNQALEVHQAIQQADRPKLETELARWVDARNAPGAQSPEALDTRIAAHEKRLALLDDQQKKLDDLLAQSETLEAALESTALELVDLTNTETLFSRGSAAEELERAMNAAQRAEERMRAQTSPQNEDDDIYLSAGTVSE